MASLSQTPHVLEVVTAVHALPHAVRFTDAPDACAQVLRRAALAQQLLSHGSYRLPTAWHC